MLSRPGTVPELMPGSGVCRRKLALGRGPALYHELMRRVLFLATVVTGVSVALAVGLFEAHGHGPATLAPPGTHSHPPVHHAVHPRNTGARRHRRVRREHIHHRVVHHVAVHPRHVFHRRRHHTAHVRHHKIAPLVFHGRTRPIGDIFGLGSFIAQRYPGYARPAVARARMLGSDWLREEFTADKLHNGPHAPYRWPVYDGVVRTEVRAGFHIMGLLDYNNTWDRHPHSYMPHWMMPRLIRDFTRYVRAVVLHYRGVISTWQIWNEPDLHIFWRPYPSAADYARLLTAAYQTIKHITPRATVVLGGPSGSDPNGVGFVRSVVKHGGRFDVLSVQPYRDVPDFSLISEVNTVRRYHKPIWFTEMGWAGERWCMTVCGPADSQADRLARLYVVGAYAGVQRVFWYDFRDDGVGANFEDHFGLLEHGFAAKPAFVAYQVAHYYLNRGIILGIDAPKPEVYAIRIRNHGRTFIVLWNNRLEDYGLSIPWRGHAQATVLDWGGRSIAQSHNGSLEVAVAPRSVVYVVPRGLGTAIRRPAASTAPWQVPSGAP